MSAKAEAVLAIVGRLNEAARSGSVTAQLALLRALAPEEWGEHRKLRVEGVGAGGGSGPPLIIEIEHPGQAPRRLEDIIRELEDNQSTSGETPRRGRGGQ